MDFLIGIVTTMAGLGVLTTPWVFRLTANSLASATIIAGGAIVTVIGLALLRRAPRPWRPGGGPSRSLRA